MKQDYQMCVNIMEALMNCTTVTVKYSDLLANFTSQIHISLQQESIKDQLYFHLLLLQDDGLINIDKDDIDNANIRLTWGGFKKYKDILKEAEVNSKESQDAMKAVGSIVAKSFKL